VLYTQLSCSTIVGMVCGSILFIAANLFGMKMIDRIGEDLEYVVRLNVAPYG
jgi:hypothetical protein